jgi:oligo-1,6-glucosidase
VSRYGDDRDWRVESAKALATVLHLQRGTPFLYQGDEIGMTNFPFTSIDQFDDVESVNWFHEAVARGVDPEEVLASLRAMSRDNSRTPMQWDASDHAGFTTGTPWLAVNPDHTEVNVADQVGVPGSVLEHHRALIALRHDERVVADGDFTLLVPHHEQIFAFVRRLDASELVVVVNFSSSPAELPESLATRCAGSQVVVGAEVGSVLQPWQSSVLRRSDIRVGLPIR